MDSNQVEETLKSDTKTNANNWLWAIVIFVVVCAVMWICTQGKAAKEKIKKRVRTNKSFQKAELCVHYKVDKKTLAKWVELFCGENLKDYKNRRRLTDKEMALIYLRFGFNCDESPVMSKATIADLSDSHTDTLRRWVIQNGASFGVSIEAYDTVNVFPPLIAHLIFKGFCHNSLEVIREEYKEYMAYAA